MPIISRFFGIIIRMFFNMRRRTFMPNMRNTEL
jgi:hypothetical protein